MAEKEKTETFYNVDSSTEEIFMEIYDKKSFPVNIKFLFQGNSKQKQLVKIKKISEEYVFELGKEILVSINEDLLDVFDDESVTILFEQEIDKIQVKFDTGKITIKDFNLRTNAGIVNKWGIDKVAKANQIEDLYSEQVKDGKEDFII